MSTNQPTTTTTREEELAYETIRNRHKLSIEEILSALTDVLEPEFPSHNPFRREPPPHAPTSAPTAPTTNALSADKNTVAMQTPPTAPCGSHSVTSSAQIFLNFGASVDSAEQGPTRQQVRHGCTSNIKEDESCRRCHARVFTAPEVDPVWAYPEMQADVVNLYTLAGRFLAWQDNHNNADRSWAAFVALPSEKRGMVPNFGEAFRVLGRKVIVRLDDFAL